MLVLDIHFIIFVIKQLLYKKTHFNTNIINVNTVNSIVLGFKIFKSKLTFLNMLIIYFIIELK